jgi:hypothetical protein
MIRFPKVGETVILTKPAITCTLDGKRVYVQALTICDVEEISADSKTGVWVGLSAQNRPDLEVFCLSGDNLIDGCYPFVAYPPNRAESAYWHERVFAAIEAQAESMKALAEAAGRRK